MSSPTFKHFVVRSFRIAVLSKKPLPTSQISKTATIDRVPTSRSSIQRFERIQYVVSQWQHFGPHWLDDCPISSHQLKSRFTNVYTENRLQWVQSPSVPRDNCLICNFLPPLHAGYYKKRIFTIPVFVDQTPSRQVLRPARGWMAVSIHNQILLAFPTLGTYSVKSTATAPTPLGSPYSPFPLFRMP